MWQPVLPYVMELRGSDHQPPCLSVLSRDAWSSKHGLLKHECSSDWNFSHSLQTGRDVYYVT